MKISGSSLLLSAFALLALLQAAAAQPALLPKAWVSKDGVDSAGCGGLTSPCRTPQQAHDNIASGGEISVLTPGDYPGPGLAKLAITKSVHFTNDGVGEAGIQATGGSTGISISAGVGDIVTLRGLVIDGQGTGAFGILLRTANALHVQNCVIRNFQQTSQGYGIFVAAVGVSTQLFVSDTLIYNNGSSIGTGGLFIRPQVSGGVQGAVNAVLDRVHFENNVDGLYMLGDLVTGAGVHVVLRDSVISGNFASGVIAQTVAGQAPAFALIERSSMVNNRSFGVVASGPGATFLLKESTITRNGTGVGTFDSGQLISYRNSTNNNNLGAEGVATSFLGPF